MIPYFELTVFYLGPIPIRVWGFFVSLGILAALSWSGRLARQAKLSSNLLWEIGTGMTIAALVGARLGHVIFYAPGFFLENPSEIYKIWHGGMSSIGGIIGALACFVYCVHRHKLEWRLWLDIISQGFPLGYAIGRIGCFLIHDHPGTLSNFIGAVKFPGGARHDLGLYLSVDAALMFGLILFLRRWPRFRYQAAGFWTSLVMIWYGLSRLALDFLRAADLPGSDTRYWGSTPAQYFGLLFIIFGMIIYASRRSNQKA